jgi:hypothetical protein
MTSIYEQHDAAFRNVSAYVVLRGKTRVATVAFKFGNAVTAYVHWVGVEMVKGRAHGGGYDRQTAAVAHAAGKIGDPGFISNGDAATYGNWQAFIEAASLDGGKRWDDAVRDAGFSVYQAV